jgi:GcrA cell cycle regulator
MKPTIDWTPAQVEELISLWRQGRTSYELATHFGVTRNSIMGKLHREKLRREKTGDPIERRALANNGTIVKRRYTRREPMLTLPSSAGSVMRIVEPAPAPPDQGQLASIVDVTGCRWPVKDDPGYVGGVAFCNHEQRDGSPYCPYHARENVAPYSREAIRRTIKQSLYLLKVAS